MTLARPYPARIAELEREVERLTEALDTREFEAYQIIGNLAERTGLFDHPEVTRALDWFAYPDDRPEEIFPWPKGGIDAIAPSEIAELERENGELKRRVDSIAEYSRAHHAGRIDELERLLETTRQQYVDADQCWRKLDRECKRLRIEVGRLQREAVELMKQDNDARLLIADLRQRLDWHKQNAEKQATRICEQDSETQRLKNREEYLLDCIDRQAARIRAQEAEIERLKAELADDTNADGDARVKPFASRRYRLIPADTGQHDLPPTRAEEEERT